MDWWAVGVMAGCAIALVLMFVVGLWPRGDE